MGEGTQATTINNDGEVREMRDAATILEIIHVSAGEPDATEIGHVRFGGGPSEKALFSRNLVGGLPDVTHGSVGAGG